MILEFTVGNYRSIAEPQTLSLVAANISGAREEAVADIGDVKVLRAAAIYGANASGKSNIWRALRDFRVLAVRSALDFQEGDELPLEPFLLNVVNEKAPTFFEMVFRLDKRTLRYGFEASAQRIESEWLFARTSSRETRLFKRERRDIEVNKRSFNEGTGKEKLVRDNALFLPVVAQWNGAQSRKIVRFFERIHTVSGLKEGYAGYTMRCLLGGKHQEAVAAFLRQLDLSLNDLKLEEISEDQLSLDFPSENDEASLDTSLQKRRARATKKMRVQMLHPIYDDEGKTVGQRALSLARHGSEGTNKLFSFAGPIIDTLANGDVLCVDELDARLHPLVTRAIINLFNSADTNPCNAQLIFNTHDTNLLSPRLLRRDQVWFAEKDRLGKTHLYSLAEFRQSDGQLARKDANFEEHYIQGRYGAVPFLGDFSSLMAQEQLACASPAQDAAVDAAENMETKVTNHG